MKNICKLLFPLICIYMCLASIVLIGIYPFMKIKNHLSSLGDTLCGMVRSTTSYTIGKVTF